MSRQSSYLLESDASADELSLRYPHVATALVDTPWAITSPMRDVIVAIAARRIAGGRLTEAEIQEAIDGRDAHREPRMITYTVAAAARGRGGARSQPTAGQIAVLPFYGVMAPRLSGMSATSGGTSVTTYMDQLKAALDDPSVSSILLEIDSPGGSSAMIEELGQLIYDSRGEKPIAAIANTMAGSAAYWIASQADELAVTPSGSVGSIGCYGLHQDLSAALERAGVKTTVIQSGASPHKTELHPFGPLSEDALAYHQGIVDAVNDSFVEAVARGRGVATGTVKADFGQGRMLMAKPAVAAGMADRVATFDQMVGRLARGEVTAGRSRTGGARVEHRDLDPVAADQQPNTDPCANCDHAASSHDGEMNDGACSTDNCDCAEYELPDSADPSSATADDVSRVTGAARQLAADTAVAELLEGAAFAALPAGADIAIKLQHRPTVDQCEALREGIAKALPGRRVIIAGPDVSIAVAEGDPPESSAPADDHPQDSLLHRRAVRAALRPAAAAVKEDA